MFQENTSSVDDIFENRIKQRSRGALRAWNGVLTTPNYFLHMQAGTQRGLRIKHKYNNRGERLEGSEWGIELPPTNYFLRIYAGTLTSVQHIKINFQQKCRIIIIHCIIIDLFYLFGVKFKYTS